ncbi:hypothetical protein AQ490_00015 [Wenjunlia vitaminophila]|uniref:DUF3311 domain-containing protein n=1 Tax=Wenjunlia vitaminophila TaxID=76728 RepID=A0A0T6LZ78_WENVI|nr:DUF3311 domain-containing protein [Wenjunlia vitaminophila]KRV51495.1 hypothetical protein AQ490_00015 [Wenjunlia vitaminophila]
MRAPRARTGARICLAAVFVGPLLAPVSMRVEPRLMGWPFFYWYQLLWVPLAAALLTCAALLRRRSRPRPAELRAHAPSAGSG